jgi:hypothetical protein
MAQIGLNHRLTVTNTLKEQTRAVYQGVLGASIASPRPITPQLLQANSRLLWQFRALAFATYVAMSSGAAAQPASAPAVPQLMDREREIALALSACPAFVAPKAGVYVLEKSGYVKARDSQNGFTAIVQHSVPSAQEPRCMDAEGTRTHLPRILKVAELRAQGVSRDEIQRIVADGFAKGVFRAPTRPGVDYMLSSENRVPNQKGEVEPYPPHVMFYAPYLTNAELGVDRNNLGPDGNPSGAAFVAGEGTPHALIIVPVPPQGTCGHVHGGAGLAQ